jgi:transcription termination/antitermination protein NusA
MTAVSPFSLLRGLRNKLTHMDSAPAAPPPAPVPAPEVRRVAADVDDALRDIPGILESMLVAFGQNGIKTVEDLAGCATDDLIGWTEQTGGKTTTHPGILGDMVLSRQQCDAIILQARIRVGWIEAAALPS